jgi:hypothetical protein
MGVRSFSFCTFKIRDSGNHWIGSWLVLRDILDVVVQRKLPTPTMNQILIVLPTTTHLLWGLPYLQTPWWRVILEKHHLTKQQIPCLFLNLKVHLPFSQQPTTGPYPKLDENPAHTFIPYFFRLILILSSHLHLHCPSGLSLHFRFSDENCVHISHSTYLTHLILLNVFNFHSHRAVKNFYNHFTNFLTEFPFPFQVSLKPKKLKPYY